jgi:excinuclease ABC subunit B
VQDLLEEIRKRAARDERVLVTTLTKRFAEELTEFYGELGVKVRYMHSDTEVLERAQLIRDLREGKYDVLVGINLLREGLDIPECSLVAILDADKEGYLRSTRSLIQTVGRAARNANGLVLMYADRVTDSMQRCIEETERRRAKQVAFNEEHGITPTTIRKRVSAIIETNYDLDEMESLAAVAEEEGVYLSKTQLEKKIEQIRKEMKDAAKSLEFERAAELRDQMLRLQQQVLAL